MNAPTGVTRAVDAFRKVNDAMGQGLSKVGEMGFKHAVKRVNELGEGPMAENNMMAVAGMVGPVAGTHMPSAMVGFEDGKALMDATGKISSRYLVRPVKDLVAHEGVDPRRVQQYVDYMQAGRDIEPLKIIKEGLKYGVEDGKHRLAAMQRLGFTHAPVELLRTH